jgi:general nucleoside transport system permease protein
MDALIFVLAGAFAMATPLLLAALGELVAEKSGVLNLSVEGMMALSAAIAFMVALNSGSFLLAFAAAAAVSALLSALFAALVLVFLANQVASGLAVGILGLGLSALLGRSYEGMTMVPLGKLSVPVLAELPVMGPILFRQDPVVYLAFASAFAIAWFLYRTRAGLRLRVVGENPASAHAIGLKPLRVRFLAILFGGGMAGIAGAYAAVVLTPLWSQGMIAGRGWIAVALVVFGAWRPLRILLGAYLFGALWLFDLAVQALGIAVPSQLLTLLPYAMTILVLAAVSSDPVRIRLNAPMSLGENLKPAG